MKWGVLLKIERIAIVLLSAVFILVSLTIAFGRDRGDIPASVTDTATSDVSENELPDGSQPLQSKQPDDTEFSETESTQPLETPTEPPASEVEPIVEPQPEYPIDATVRICIGGDTSIDGEFADVCYQYGVDYPWRQVSDILNEADISIVNLETCVSDEGVSEKKEGFGFRTPPEMLEGFVNAGIDMVNLANNHVRDFGYDALLATFDNLDAYGIDYFGAGRDLDQAGGLVIKEVNGVKIGFTGCNRVWLTDDCAAADGHAGVNQVHSLSKESTQAYLERIREYDSMVDVLICFMHYGTEEVFDVTSYQKDMSRALIDNGVDIFVGGHSHTLQPIEFYNDKLIIYSIGNFIFWHVDDDIDGLSAIFDLTVDREGFVSLKLHPVFIKRYRANLVEKGSDRYEQIIALSNTLCNPYGLAFDEDGNMIEYVPPLPEETDATDITDAVTEIISE